MEILRDEGRYNVNLSEEQNQLLREGILKLSSALISGETEVSFGQEFILKALLENPSAPPNYGMPLIGLDLMAKCYESLSDGGDLSISQAQMAAFILRVEIEAVSEQTLKAFCAI